MTTAALLFEAVHYGNTAILEVLLRHGAGVDYTNRFGQTVLHIAASWANVQAVELLMRLETAGTRPHGRCSWRGSLRQLALQVRLSTS
jgi:ankyrin repeat protein